MTASFAELTEAFLDALFRAEPALATALGAPGYDDLLPDRSAGALAAREAAEDGFAARYAALADAELSDDERVDRDLVLMWLAGERARRPHGFPWRDAESYVDPAVEAILTLVLRADLDPAAVTAGVAARLAAWPALLDAGRANLRPELVAPRLARRALDACRGLPAFLRTGLAALLPTGGDPAVVEPAAQAAATALTGWVAYLDGQVLPAATGSYALGEEAYTALLRDAEGLDLDARTLHERGRRLLDELTADLRRRALALQGDDDLERLSRNAAADRPESPEQMLAEYAALARRAREFAYRAGLVSEPPGESCDVRPSLPFQRATAAVAFYFPPPALTRGRRGTFFVPFPPDGASAEEVEGRLASNNRWMMPTIAVHEAYPGHHWHFAWLAHAQVRPLRLALATAFFCEGWALYAEEVMREAGFYDDPRHEIGQVRARAFRAARIVVDTGLHLGTMSTDEAVEFLVEHAAISPETAQAEVSRYCAWPTQAVSYLTGAIEIRRMADRWRAGGGTLREFHDRLAGAGPLPLGLAERVVLAGLPADGARP